jgi:uncharacterized heparinase superfamily protein
MKLARAVELAHKALTRPPRQTLARLGEEATRVARRPWSRIYPVVLTERALASASGHGSIDALWRELAASPFFLSPASREATVAAHRARFPGAEREIVAAADRILLHEFDLLGSGPKCLGPKLPWHEDFKTGRVWPLDYSVTIEYSELDRSTDVKVPWELSRCQHFPRLGQAYWLTRDEKYAREYIAEIDDWIECNPWAYGVNWACAMDVALRAVSWIWGFYFFADSPSIDQAFRGRLLRSLYLHGEYVATHLEKGPVNGNHYLSDAVGLVFLGAFFRRTEKGRRWLDLGRAIVFDEMFAQVTEDGVDFEVSTAYHRLVLELFLTAYQLLRLHGETIPEPQWRQLERMFEFVEAYTKPNGLAPLIGDADDGRVQSLGRQEVNDHRYLLSTGAVLFGRADFKRAAREMWEESFWFLGRAAAETFESLPAETGVLRSKAFPQGGFFVLRDDTTHVIVDCGDVGMRGIGGHGHNDALSFELVLDGTPIVTDCGAYLYTASREWRNKFRSTAFHNTIQVDGEEINRFISPDHLWQLRNDAQPDRVMWTFDGVSDRFNGSHTGYLRLDSPVRPARALTLRNGKGSVHVTDTLEGAGIRQLSWRFTIDPTVHCDVLDGRVRFRVGHDERWLVLRTGFEDLAVALESGWVSPSYGVRHRTAVVTFTGRVLLPLQITYSFLTSLTDNYS